MSGLETIVLVPLVAGALQAVGKISQLRAEITAREGAIVDLQQQLSEARAAGSAAGGSDGRNAPRAVLYSSLAVSCGLLCYHAASLWRRSGDARAPAVSSRASARPATPLNRPPAAYQPTKVATDVADGSAVCAVCLHNARDTLLLPCHHLALCWPCAEFLCPTDAQGAAEPLATCPICRSQVSSKTFALLP